MGWHPAWAWDEILDCLDLSIAVTHNTCTACTCDGFRAADEMNVIADESKLFCTCTCIVAGTSCCPLPG